jgi:hypothetical protein
MLFVSQKEAKIMRNRLHFASFLHGAKKNLSEKGTPYPRLAGMARHDIVTFHNVSIWYGIFQSKTFVCFMPEYFF